jgi:KUP system potassium uptake protein
VWAALLVLVGFLSFDIPFVLANAEKIADGGWLPLVIGVGLSIVMLNWYAGRLALGSYFRANARELAPFLKTLEASLVGRLPGVGVFMASDPRGAPPVLVRMVERFRVLYGTNVLLTVVTERAPFMAPTERSQVTPLDHGFLRVVLRYGFMEVTCVAEDLLRALRDHGVDARAETVSFVLGRETIVCSPEGQLSGVREQLFAFLSRNARNATDYFGLPLAQVVELGSHVDL